MGDYAASMFAVFAEDGSWVCNIDGPAGWSKIMAMGAGYGMVYAGANGEIGWGAYTGTKTAVTWTTVTYASVYGLAVWENLLFVACGIDDADNIFIHTIAGDGTPSTEPVWSCQFTENTEVNGGIDYDGEFLWVYPQQDYLYKLSIDWDPEALDSDTWAGIKTSY